MTEEFTFIAKDTDKDIVLYKHEMRAVAYEPKWQELRINLSFHTYDRCRASIALVTAYTMNVSGNDAYERACRLFRAMNLLNALPLGHIKQGGIRIISKDREDLIRKYRKEYREQLEENGYPSEWDWAIVRRSCNSMAGNKDGFQILVAIHKDLQPRARSKPSGKLELRYFMTLIEEALNV